MQKDFVVFVVDSNEFKEILGVKEVDFVLRTRIDDTVKKSSTVPVSVSFFNPNQNPSITFLGIEAELKGEEVVNINLNFPDEFYKKVNGGEIETKKVKKQLSKILSEKVKQEPRIELD